MGHVAASPPEGHPTRDDPTPRWLVQLKKCIGWQQACVTMANTNARILWPVLTREKPYDPNHVSVKPQSKVPNLK